MTRCTVAARDWLPLVLVRRMGAELIIANVPAATLKVKAGATARANPILFRPNAPGSAVFLVSDVRDAMAAFRPNR